MVSSLDFFKAVTGDAALAEPLVLGEVLVVALAACSGTAFLGGHGRSLRRWLVFAQFELGDKGIVAGDALSPDRGRL